MFKCVITFKLNVVDKSYVYVNTEKFNVIT